MTIRIATDIGGTFTDLVTFDEESGALTTGKASSTPGNFARGVLDAIADGGVSLQTARDFVHGCTVVINAVTQRSGARTALVTTAGFRDLLEIARGNRPDMYNLRFAKPTPFVPRRHRFEVRERVDHAGAVLTPLEEADLDAVVAACGRDGIEAIAICLLHAYANPAHEQRCAAYLRERLPGVPVSLSSEVTGEWREYERSSTTVLNAYVQPIVDRYLGSLEEGLGAGGMACEPHVMQSNGGTASFASARERPIYLLESGPVSGVMGGAIVGQAIGEEQVITLDIGGTTAKCSLVEGGAPRVTTDYKVEWRPEWPGYPVKAPVVDIVEIGAGGGSIAWFDQGGALRVGPLSAGADPGPAAYGRGGVAPTLTDAKLIAGVINPDYCLGGRMRLDPGLARRAFAPIAERLGVSVEEAANGIIRLADHHMINALKLVSVRRGYDPRGFALVAMGGGGPMHAAALAQELQLKKVVVPPLPGHFSAWAMLVTRPRTDLIRTTVLRAAEVAPERVAALFAGLRDEALERLGRDGARPEELSWQYAVDMRYLGQEHTVKVPLALAGPPDMAALTQQFHAAHRREYTFELPGATVELVNFHLTAWRNIRRPVFAPIANAGRSAEAALKGRRRVDFDGAGVHQTPFYERDLLPAGFVGHGPLIIEEPASTTVVYPGQRLEVDPLGNLIIEAAR